MSLWILYLFSFYFCFLVYDTTAAPCTYNGTIQDFLGDDLTNPPLTIYLTGSDADNDAQCCSYCYLHSQCEFWVRDTSKTKQSCYLRKNFRGFVTSSTMRGSFRNLVPQPHDICGTASENSNLILTAPSTQLLGNIIFSSYGDPTGTCGSFNLGSHHSANTSTIIANKCYGQSTCTIAATNTQFGDPNYGFGKSLAVEIQTYPNDRVCGSAFEGATLDFDLPDGYIFGAVLFASYGYGMSGGCGQWIPGPCTTTGSSVYIVVESFCLGKNNCSMGGAGFNDLLFDPCNGYNKVFVVELQKTDVNECETNNGGCSTNPLVTCNNIPGSYYCDPCPTGFEGDGFNCTDINECLDNNGNCTSLCLNQIPGYTCLPQLVEGSLQLAGNEDFGQDYANGTIALNSSENGTILSMNILAGTFTLLNLTTNTTRLQFSLTTKPNYYSNCIKLEYELLNPTSNLYRVNCTLPIVAGIGYSFTLSSCAQNMSYTIIPTYAASLICTQSSDTISTFYTPPPTITRGTLRIAPNLPNLVNGTAYLIASNSLGENINFLGSNFGNDANVMNITYGPSNQTNLFTCLLLPELSNDTSITCFTQPGGYGQNLIFEIVLYGYRVSGIDMYSYKSIPVVDRVYGCDKNTTEGGTAMCSTEGGTVITIEGSSFVSPVAIFIEGILCTIRYPYTFTSATCHLPAGVGLLQSLLLGSSDQFSRPVPFISYAPPVITLLMSDDCVPKTTGNQNIQLENCARLGGVLLTMEGYNFGESGGSVLIGGQPCDNVTHDSLLPHRLLTCIIPPNNVLDAPVLFLQGGQFSGSGPTLSYTQCVPGTYQIDLLCLPCVVGKYSERSGQTVCNDCLAGYFSERNNSISCSPCLSGYAQKGTRQSTCLSCIPGYYTSSPAQITCVKCDAGTFNPHFNASNCSNCLPGSYSDLEGAIVCKTCSLGSAVGFPGSQTACPACPMGYFANTTGLSACEACSGGTYQSHSAQSSCSICQMGFFSGSAMTSCSLCSTGSITSNNGSHTCQTCLDNSNSNTERTQCLCPIGKYGKSKTANSPPNCYDCPKGTICESEGILYNEMSTQPGWWRLPFSSISNNNSETEELQFYQCMFSSWCLGGLNSTCEAHRTGPICALCETGYQSSSSNSDCSQCPTTSVAIGVTFFLAILVLVGLGLMYYIVLRSDKATREAGEDNSAKGRKNTAAGTLVHMVTNIGSTDPNLAGEFICPWYDSQEFMDPKINAIGADLHFTTELRIIKNPMYTMKIILSFLQISTNLTFISTIPWPHTYQVVMSAINFININFVPWQSVGCAVDVQYYTKLLVLTLTPPVLIIGLVLFYFLPLYILDQRDFGDSNRSRLAHQRRRQQLFKLILFTIFLTYPSMSSMVLSYWHCHTIQDVHYLVSDFTLQCYDHKWYQFLPLAVVMLLVYPIGVPLVFFILLFRSRYHLKTNQIKNWLGFLYEAYYYDQWWFELLDMLHKLFLTSILRFLPTSFQLPTAMTIVIFYLIVVLVSRPYLRFWNDIFHILAQIYLFLILLAALLQDTAGANNLADIVLSIFILGLTAFLTVICIVEAVLTFRSMFRKYQREQAERLAMREEKGKMETGHSVSEIDPHQLSELSHVPTGLHSHENSGLSRMEGDQTLNNSNHSRDSLEREELNTMDL